MAASHSLSPHSPPLTTFGGHEDHLQPRGAPGLRLASRRQGGDPPGAPRAPTGAGSVAATSGGGGTGGGNGSGLVEWGAQLATRLALTDELKM